jgi:hypothetical protein
MFLLSSCSNSKPIQIINGSYNYTPQEFVDLINSTVKKAENQGKQVLSWPDYFKSEVPIYIGDSLNYTITEMSILI